EHACRADGEEHRREHEVVVQRRHQGPPGGAGAAPPRVEDGSRRASTTAPTIATRISTEVTSNANAYSPKSSRPMARTELTAAVPKGPDSPPPFVNAHTSSMRSTTASAAPNRIAPGW